MSLRPIVIIPDERLRTIVPPVESVTPEIVKQVKDAKIKVQAQIQAEQVRVTGKKRDDLQQVIALLRDADIGPPLQFTNFRD